jgi:hypothetical protein
MKNLLIAIAFFTSFGLQSQALMGKFIELTNSRTELTLPKFEYAIFEIETEIEPKTEKDLVLSFPFLYKISPDGDFQFDLSKVKGKTLNLYFSSDNYAYLLLKNIPKNEVSNIIKILPAIRNIYEATCGFDCLELNNKKTYKRKVISVNTNDKTLRFIRKSNNKVSKSIYDILLFEADFYYEFDYQK